MTVPSLFHFFLGVNLAAMAPPAIALEMAD